MSQRVPFQLTEAEKQKILSYRRKQAEEEQNEEEFQNLIKSFYGTVCFFCEGKGHMCDECPLLAKIHDIVENDLPHLRATKKAHLKKLSERRKEFEEEHGRETFDEAKEFSFIKKKTRRGGK